MTRRTACAPPSGRGPFRSRDARRRARLPDAVRSSARGAPVSNSTPAGPSDHDSEQATGVPVPVAARRTTVHLLQGLANVVGLAQHHRRWQYDVDLHHKAHAKVEGAHGVCAAARMLGERGGRRVDSRARVRAPMAMILSEWFHTIHMSCRTNSGFAVRPTSMTTLSAPSPAHGHRAPDSPAAGGTTRHAPLPVWNQSHMM